MKSLASRKSFLSQVCVLVLLSQVVPGQGARNNWEAVQRTKPGSKLEIKTKAGQKLQGRLESVTADSLSLAVQKGQNIELRREEIARIRRKSTGQTIGAAALGGGLGLAGGYGIGYGVGEATKADGPTEYGGAILGAAAGAVAGALIGSRGQLIYEAP